MHVVQRRELRKFAKPVRSDREIHYELVAIAQSSRSTIWAFVDGNYALETIVKWLIRSNCHSVKEAKRQICI